MGLQEVGMIVAGVLVLGFVMWLSSKVKNKLSDKQ